MEEECQAPEVNAALAPALRIMQHCGEDRDRRRRVKNGRNSEPEEIHLDLTLKGLWALLCDTYHHFGFRGQVAANPPLPWRLSNSMVNVSARIQD